jgi:flagellar biosynthesis/type III secretory pathway ATPase
MQKSIVDKNKRNLTVSLETYNELIELGKYRETMDQIVRKCVDSYKERIQEGKN